MKEYNGSVPQRIHCAHNRVIRAGELKSVS